MSVTPPAESADFRDVDGYAEPAAMISALDQLAADPAVQRLRAAGIEMLRVGRGQRLLDVGCGTGATARMLAELVGPTGAVVGLERSSVMLAEARRRSDGSDAVEFGVGDVARLELTDASVDGVWCERVLQHVDDPRSAVQEMVRVTRPGGRIVVIDTDWGMNAIHGSDPATTRRVVTAWSDSLAAGTVGRELPSLFARAGLDEVRISAATMLTTDGMLVPGAPFTLMAAAAERAGVIDRSEATAWLDRLCDAAHTDQFFWAVTMFAVGGRRPD